MSRKYCEVCREPHRNGGAGLCDKHQAEKDEEEAAKYHATNAAWTRFLNRSDEERWGLVFDFMRAQGWEGP